MGGGGLNSSPQRAWVEEQPVVKQSGAEPPVKSPASHGQTSDLPLSRKATPCRDNATAAAQPA